MNGEGSCFHLIELCDSWIFSPCSQAYMLGHSQILRTFLSLTHCNQFSMLLYSLHYVNFYGFTIFKFHCKATQRRQWHPTPVLLPGRLQSMELWRVGRSWVTSLSLFTFMHWRRKWQPTPMFLLGESQGRGSLVGCCLWGRTESDTTEAT